ncbi:HRDC domain-containing protein [Streptomyces sp. NBC_01803]|uniref:HRDC domain-containing protein n=1 Tax=Streptomyces sp. NBC_01803 TaxID=2975946 RepID=UPI002DDA7DF9|nr:HRDC domain-containing protein [Streptomyces sp. NBC_01803]WSA43799.1 HRDC domain-containing protein [Streptomyces sp. NBC_01803]
MTDAQQTAETASGLSTSEPSGPAPVPLLAPREGVPPVITDDAALAEAVAAFAAGTGPVAVDAERASGYRYGQRAYLVQLRREGAGTALIDPIACPDLSGLGSVLLASEWVLHAATQDLPCLRDIGMVPTRLFDTELAGRLAGFARVGLGVMVETVLGYSLEKGHSAVDWSSRPLPEPWLRYAALDVELLTDLRDALEEELTRQGKLEWALEEFAAIAAAPPPPPRKDPWRRTSGVHKVRRRRQLAVVRELWSARDQVAQRRDLSPGKVLSDAAIVAAAQAMPADVRALAGLHGFGHRMGRRQLQQWQTAIDRARELAEAELPQPSQPTAGPPPPRAWAEKDPAAAARLTAARAAVTAHAEELNLPQENLLAPDVVRRLCWEPPADPAPERVAQALRLLGAREWQIAQTADLLTGALAESA